MKISKTIKTSFGDFEIKVDKDKYKTTVEKEYPEDSTFTVQERLALIDSIKNYPKGGLGECLIKASNKRGYKRDPNYSKFTTKKSKSDVRCQVVMLKEDYASNISFAEHLRQFRRIRNLVAMKFEISKKDARYLYNNLLATDPIKLAELLK